MILTNNTNVLTSPIWNVVKDWNNDDKVQLITLLSISLTKSSVVREKSEEKTKRMLAKYAGCWKGNDSPEDTIKCINEGRHSSFEPLKF